MIHDVMCITSLLRGHHVTALAHRSCSLAHERVTSHLMNLREMEIRMGGKQVAGQQSKPDSEDEEDDDDDAYFLLFFFFFFFFFFSSVSFDLAAASSAASRNCLAKPSSSTSPPPIPGPTGCVTLPPPSVMRRSCWPPAPPVHSACDMCGGPLQ